MSKTKDVVIYVRNVSVKKFTAPVSTLTHLPPKHIVPYMSPKKEIVPISKKKKNETDINPADEEYIYYML